MKNFPLTLSILGLLVMACSPDLSDQHQASDFLLIPYPAALAPGVGYFELNESVQLKYDAADADLSRNAKYLQDWLETYGLETLAEGEEGSNKNSVVLTVNPEMETDTYTLTVTRKGILIQGGSGASVFYGIQSLTQLIRQQMGGGETLEIPCVHLEDQPAFGYRGLHLDVGRHLFPVSFIKKYIDLLARYKMNRFHWHLTEDQGWRIEIKKYPKLQEIAAYRDETLIGHYNDTPQRYDGTRYGGYYTQEEVREIVAYAADRYVTIIPEIEMPGHAQAALAAYPELSCTGGDIRTATKWGISEEVYCPTEQTFTFLENVLTEVMELFPSKYIHIGGDECPKTRWKESAFCQNLIREKGLKDEHGLQSYFITRMEKFLNENGRQIIGWDEILEGGLAPNATVMSWRGEDGGIEAARMGHDVIMTPTGYCYFDYYQSQHPEEPLAIGGFIPLEKVYHYHPVPEELSAEEAQYIKGVQGNLWTEYIKTPEKAEYMAFPRAIALAEVAWTPRDKKDFPRFLASLETHLQWLKEDGVNAANHLYDLEATTALNEQGQMELSFQNLVNSPAIRYTIDGSQPTADDWLADGPVTLKESGIYTGQAFEGSRAVGRPASLEFNRHLGVGAQIELEHLPAERYSAGGIGAILNGIEGSNERYGDREWLGFEGKDFIARIDLGSEKQLNHADFRFFNGPGQWIYPPREVQIELLDADEQRVDLRQSRVNIGTDKIVSTRVELSGQNARYLKIRIPNYGIIPAGRQGSGHAAWLFIDEINLN